MGSKKQNNQAKQDNSLLFEKFSALLKNTSLAYRYKILNKNHIQYLKDDLILGWDNDIFVNLIENIQQEITKTSLSIISWHVKEALMKIGQEEALSAISNGVKKDELYLKSLLDKLENDSLETKLRQLVEAIRQEIKKYNVFVPVDGLRVDIRSLEMGRVTFYPSNGGPLVSVISKFDKDAIEELTRKLSQMACYAVINDIEGDEEFAIEEAIKLTQEAFKILNFYLEYWRRWSSHQIKIAIMGEVLNENSTMFITQITNDKIRFNGKNSFTNSYKIDEDEINDWKLTSFDKVVACFYTNSLSDTQKRIKRCITWYSKGIDAENDDEKYVAMAVALESLLIGDESDDIMVNTGSINQRLADRVAFLLGQNYQDREKYHGLIKKLYTKRSKIVHSGASVDKKDLAAIDSLVVRSIHKFLELEFSSWSAFLAWERQQKFSLPSDSNS